MSVTITLRLTHNAQYICYLVQYGTVCVTYSACSLERVGLGKLSCILYIPGINNCNMLAPSFITSSTVIVFGIMLDFAPCHSGYGGSL